MNHIDVLKLKSMLDSGEDVQIIDIREDYELETEGKIGGLHIPMGELMGRIDQLREDVPVVFHCRSGKRSENMLNFLKMKNLYADNYFNLIGGINAWKQL
ncbi:MAG: NADH oxidase [Crocinitomicaceae bacterium]|nr:NADH oxidase [Crocinitomicaceae bacterium]|tara:strand:- start:327 stop:626 length:300 start_codon:yes stop_codon:yes gene_type:complete